MMTIDDTTDEVTLEDLAALYPPAKAKRQPAPVPENTADDLAPVYTRPQPPAVKPTEPTHVVVRLKAWVAATYPDELHVHPNDNGYFAGANRDAKDYNEAHDYARLMYYGGAGSKGTVTAKLEAAGKRLDLLGIAYTWGENDIGYKFLLVDGAKLPNPE